MLDLNWFPLLPHLQYVFFKLFFILFLFTFLYFSGEKTLTLFIDAQRPLLKSLIQCSHKHI